MKKALVSVIVPVYNTSDYLKKCLDSIIDQTLENIEIILINDVSPDPLDEVICKKYAKEDSRIIYIQHKINEGSGGARNTGIKNARGKYLAFVDSDDYITPDMLELSYNEAKKTGADIVNFGFNYLTDAGEIIDTLFFECDTKANLLKNFLDDRATLNPAVWDKLYKRSLFIDNNIKFVIGTYYEDLIIMAELLYYAKRVVNLKKPFYFYVKREGSIIQSYSEKHIDDMFIVLDKLKIFLDSVGLYEEYFESLHNRFWINVRYFTATSLTNADENIKKRLLSYLGESVVKKNIYDARYYFPHRYYSQV